MLSVFVLVLILAAPGGRLDERLTRMMLLSSELLNGHISGCVHSEIACRGKAAIKRRREL